MRVEGGEMRCEGGGAKEERGEMRDEGGGMRAREKV